MVIAQPALNRSRSLWGDDAGEFRPERFDRDGLSFNLIQSKAFGCPGNAAAGLSGHAFGFAPFGAGRRCGLNVFFLFFSYDVARMLRVSNCRCKKT